MKQYKIERMYSDGDFVSEASRGASFPDILYACSVWLEDPDCIEISIYCFDDDKFVMDYHR